MIPAHVREPDEASVGDPIARLARDPIARAWLAWAVAALGAGAAFAAIVALGRVVGPIAGVDGSRLFRPALVMHVNLATLAWMGCLSAAWWHALRPSSSAPDRLAPRLAGLGIVGMVAAWAQAPEPVLSNYVPVLDHPVFIGALGAVLLASGWAAARVCRWRAGDPPWRRAWRAAALAYLIALGVLVASAGHFWRSPVAGGWPAFAEALFWPFGHSLQFVFVLLTMGAWAWVCRDRLGAGRWARGAIGLAVLPAFGVPVLLAAAGGDPTAVRESLTRLMQFGAWPGAVMLMLVCARGRPPGHTPADAEGQRVAFASMALFLGGLCLGAAIRGNTTMVPAHYHGTVGAGTLMGIALVLRAWQQRSADLRHAQSERARPDARQRIDRLIVIGYAVGFVLLILGLAIAGSQAVPRKAIGLNAVDGHRVGAAIAMGLGATLAIAAIGALALRGVALGVSAARSTASRAPTAARTVDRRWRRAAGTVLAVALVGAVLAPWIGSSSTGTVVAKAGPPLSGVAAEIDARFRQGVVMLHARQHEHAVTAFHRVLVLDPSMPEAHVNLGFALLGLGRAREARDFFESAIDLRHEQLNAYYGLAMALESMDDLPGAVGAMRTYTHLARADDPYLAKARSALWEWEQRLPRGRR